MSREDLPARLLGPPRIERAGAHFDVPDSAPGYLFCYLAVRAEWVRREEVAAQFWPDASEGASQHNLRVNLNRLRPLLTRWSAVDALHAEKRRVRIVLASDVAAFVAAHEAGDWSAATAIPQRAFLDGLTFRTFPVLGEWAHGERQRLLELWRESLLRAAPVLPPAAMTECARRYHATDPFDEAAVRILLGALVATDRHEEAASVYRRFAERVRRECEEAPGAELQQLARRLPGLGTEAEASGVGAGPSLRPMASAGPSVRRVRAPTLVGRDDERRALRDPAHRVVLLAGDEGMGKTRVLEEEFPRACWLCCRDAAARAPLRPLAEWLDDQRDSLPPLEGSLRDLRRLLPDDAGGEVLPTPTAAEVLPRVLDAASTLAEATAATVIVDDAQWIDPGTARLVMLLARRGRVRLVVAYRVTQLNEDAARLMTALRDEIDAIAEVRLQPLTATDLGRLLASATGVAESCAGEAGEWLARRCAGNPFFALELLRSMPEAEASAEAPDGWHALLARAVRHDAPSAVPARLLDLVRGRLRRLGEITQRVLGTAAVAGDCRHADALASAAGVSPWALAEALDEATAAGLVDGERFSHDLVREAMCGVLAPSVLRLLHAEVAKAYARRLPFETLAYHWWQAGDADRALSATVDAVDHARRRGLQADVLPLLERTLRRPLDSAARGRMLATRALLRHELADAEGAAGDAAAALEEALAPEDRARTLVVQARLAFQAGSASRAADLLTEAERSNPRDAEALRLRTQLALVGGDSGSLAQALEAEILALRNAPPTASLVGALTSLGAIHDENGAPERGLPLHHEALMLARRLNARSQHVDVAINMLWCLTALPGRSGDGFAIGEEALALGEYDGSDTLRNNLAWAYADAGRLDDALRLYRRLTECGDPTLACIAWSKVVDLEARRRGAHGIATDSVDRMLHAMARTDFYVAHASAIVAALNHGTDEQARLALDWLRPQQKLDPWLQRKLDDAMADRQGRGP
jgi:DNA-binding SARP family transcriptional activator/tetratricopeptide (TPR) repeat protein